jgi:D-glycero-D-manno-heptose 1,7-bisphosphate phosphatase
MSKKLSIDQGWSLFLDRDGVINQRIPNDYVKLPDEFEFIPGVTQALGIFAGIFNSILVITNQQGIGRGLMTNSQLNQVHDKMLQKVNETGGRIDAVFYSPDLKNSGSFTRKPSVGLGLKARKQFPSINFKRSIMAGDTYSDILFGHRLGMVTVLIGTDKEVAFQCAGMLDYSFPDLLSFAEYLKINLG